MFHKYHGRYTLSNNHPRKMFRNEHVKDLLHFFHMLYDKFRQIFHNYHSRHKWHHYHSRHMWHHYHSRHIWYHYHSRHMLTQLPFQTHFAKPQGSLNKFPDFFVWALILIVHTWNSSPLRSTLIWLQCTCCAVPTTSGRSHGNPLVWACQWPSSQPLSSRLSYNDSLWA